MIRASAKQLSGSAPAIKAGNQPCSDLGSATRANRLEMLATASQLMVECPTWIIMELEARERAGTRDDIRPRKAMMMLTNSHDFVRPRDDAERAYLESQVRDDFDRCHPGDTFEDMKWRIPFSREDRGLYRDWLVVAAAKAASLSPEAKATAGPFLIAAE